MMFPDKASLYLCGVYDKDTRDSKMEWWQNVWDFDMSSIGKKSIHEVYINYNEQNYIITEDVKLLVRDCFSSVFPFSAMHQRACCRPRALIHPPGI